MDMGFKLKVRAWVFRGGLDSDSIPVTAMGAAKSAPIQAALIAVAFLATLFDGAFFFGCLKTWKDLERADLMNEAFLGRVRASDNGKTFLRPIKTDLENLASIWLAITHEIPNRRMRNPLFGKVPLNP